MQGLRIDVQLIMQQHCLQWGFVQRNLRPGARVRGEMQVVCPGAVQEGLQKRLREPRLREWMQEQQRLLPLASGVPRPQEDHHPAVHGLLHHLLQQILHQGLVN